MKKMMVLVVVASFLIPALSSAKRVKYEAVEVTNGGTIQGKVKATEKVKDPVIPITIKPKKNQEETELERKICIHNPQGQQADMYLLSPSNEVKNVLVIVENVKKGKAPPKKDLVIDNHDCKFVPLVGIAYVKSNYIIKNSDPLLHNTNLGKVLEGGVRRAVYNLALPRKDQVIKKINRVPGLIQVKCDAHAWMRAYVYSSRHPYVAITDANGHFEIKDLLPGKYTVRFWHEGFEDVVQEIEVKAGKAFQLDATFAKTRTPAFLSKD
jgi:hypothetical protein